jgi:threonine dehydratase
LRPISPISACRRRRSRSSWRCCSIPDRSRRAAPSPICCCTTLHSAFAAGAPVDAPAGGIAADSLAPKRVGTLMFPIAQAHVERVVLVSDDAIRQAQAALWSRLRLVAEPGGATAFAALLSGRYRPSAGERVAVLLCGANTTAVNFDG